MFSDSVTDYLWLVFFLSALVLHRVLLMLLNDGIGAF